MQIFIQSQNKKKLLKLEKAEIHEAWAVNANDPNNVNVTNRLTAANIFVNDYSVARYDSTERAVEVLEEISNLIAKQNARSGKQASAGKQDEASQVVLYRMPAH